MGATLEGYASDMTRMVFLGKRPSNRIKRIYRAVLEAQQAAHRGGAARSDGGARGPAARGKP